MENTAKQTDIIAQFNFENIELKMYWDGATKGNKVRIDYEFIVDGKILMEGNDFCTMSYPDSIESVIQLLGFIILCVGDTDNDYFKNHTPEMLAWLQTQQRDTLNSYVNDYEYMEREQVDFFKNHTKIG